MMWSITKIHQSEDTSNLLENAMDEDYLCDILKNEQAGTVGKFPFETGHERPGKPQSAETCLYMAEDCSEFDTNTVVEAVHDLLPRRSNRIRHQPLRFNGSLTAPILAIFSETYAVTWTQAPSNLAQMTDDAPSESNHAASECESEKERVICLCAVVASAECVHHKVNGTPVYLRNKSFIVVHTLFQTGNSPLLVILLCSLRTPQNVQPRPSFLIC